MKKKILFSLVVICSLFTLTGCLRREKEIKIEEPEDLGMVLTLEHIDSFKGEYALVKSEYNDYYIIDKNFNVVSKAIGSDYIDGYTIVTDEEDNSKHNVYDVNGKVVYSYSDSEYKKVELLEEGCLLIQKQEDTYNSSKTTTGIYDLKEEKYVLKPSEKYNEMYSYGDDVVHFGYGSKEIFNLRTKKIVTFDKYINRGFRDGYSADSYDFANVDYALLVLSDTGEEKRLDGIRGELVHAFNHKNGMNVEVDAYQDHDDGNRIKTYTTIFNFETGEVIDVTKEFYFVSNKPEYTKDGYALIIFKNQGGTSYYTIIDKKGKMVFEPVKVKGKDSFVNENLYEGNYIIMEEDGKQILLDKNNKEIIRTEEREDFVDVSNNAVIVRYNKPNGLYKYYFKDLKGKEIVLRYKENSK